MGWPDRYKVVGLALLIGSAGLTAGYVLGSSGDMPGDYQSGRAELEYELEMLKEKGEKTGEYE